MTPEASSGPAPALSPRAIFERLSQERPAAVPEGSLTFEDEAPGEGTSGAREACVRLGAAAAAALPSVMARLRDDPALAFDFLQNLTAVDWIKRDVIEVVYHLFSYRHRHSIGVKVDLPRAVPRVPSVAALWPSANWMEREQFDLLGVVFPGHPDLRRLLMPDDWVGHPMRKDYREPKAYRGMPTSRPSPMDLLQTFDRAHATAPPAVTTTAASTPAPGAPAGAAPAASGGKQEGSP